MRPSGKRRSGPIGGDAGGSPTPGREESGTCACTGVASASNAHATSAHFIDIFRAREYFSTAVIFSPYSDGNTGFAAA
jgi:hypothetical protein